MAASIDQRDLHRRHPLCPSCGYDLVATLAANTRICPECGEEFELHELPYERRAGDWSNAIALRRATVALGMRLIMASVIAMACSALGIELLNHAVPRIVPFVVALIQAVGVGMVCSRRLTDQAGFQSLLLIFGACVIAVAASEIGFIAAATWIVQPKLAGITFLHVSVSVLGAFVVIMHDMLTNE